MQPDVRADAFSGLAAYKQELVEALSQAASGMEKRGDDIKAHLDGLAYQRLRQTVPLKARRTSSTFFTSSTLRARLAARYKRLIASGTGVLDPACGAGDLLLAALEVLPKTWPPLKTANFVAEHFYGRELIPILAELSADRLRLALQLMTGPQLFPSNSQLPNIQPGDGLSLEAGYSEARLVLLNPPYARIVSPKQSWGEGLVSQAAPFTLDVLKFCRPGTRVAAILPDVLRSGSRYGKWRSEVDGLADLLDVDIVGLFDTWTDVDVFIAHLKVKDRPTTHRKLKTLWQADSGNKGTASTLGSIASISVGDVVPHRHKEEGPALNYLCVRSAAVGQTITSTPTRRFTGRTHQAPFVLIRRTSAPTRRPGPRLSTSVVAASLGTVAIENHLIIVKPLHGDEKECEFLAQQLRQESVTKWLDDRLRTRHLTTTMLLQLPLPETYSMPRGLEAHSSRNDSSLGQAG
ncbi:hypothetical protein [Dactylosporangium sp. NPDC005555]|uniref:hypothetical protein n=1 Tax=Dactylosporangium sp. NPDC005555 TaxID=3154889 RepID=UPI0033BA8A1A